MTRLGGATLVGTTTAHAAGCTRATTTALCPFERTTLATICKAGAFTVLIAALAVKVRANGQ